MLQKHYTELELKSSNYKIYFGNKNYIHINISPEDLEEIFANGLGELGSNEIYLTLTARNNFSNLELKNTYSNCSLVDITFENRDNYKVIYEYKGTVISKLFKRVQTILEVNGLTDFIEKNNLTKKTKDIEKFIKRMDRMVFEFDDYNFDFFAKEHNKFTVTKVDRKTKARQVIAEFNF